MEWSQKFIIPIMVMAMVRVLRLQLTFVIFIIQFLSFYAVSITQLFINVLYFAVGAITMTMLYKHECGFGFGK